MSLVVYPDVVLRLGLHLFRATPKTLDNAYSENAQCMQKTMSAETWDMDIVVALSRLPTHPTFLR